MEVLETIGLISAIVFFLAFIAAGIFGEINYHVPLWLTVTMIASGLISLVCMIIVFGPSAIETIFNFITTYV